MKYFNAKTKKFSVGQKPSGKYWVVVKLVINRPNDYPAKFYSQTGDAVFDEYTTSDVATYDLIPLEILKQKLYLKNNDECGACRGRSITFKGVDVDISTKGKRDGIFFMHAKDKKFKANKSGDVIDLTPQDVIDLQSLLDDDIQERVDNELSKNKTVSDISTHRELADYFQTKVDL